jgi:methyl-accepting chemotaxis protein
VRQVKNKLKNLKIGTKLFLSFGIVILLTLLVSYLSLAGMKLVEDEVSLADDANGMIKSMLDIRKEEKNFILSEDEEYISEVESKVEDILVDAKEIKAKFTKESDIAIIDEIITNISDYKNSFFKYILQHSQREELAKVMVENARAAIKLATEVRDNQAADVKLALANNSADEVVENNIEVADDSNRIIKDVLTIRTDERNFIISEEQEDATLVELELEKIIEQVQGTKGKLDLDEIEERKKLDQLILDISEYRTAFIDYTKAIYQQNSLEEELMAEALAVEQSLQSLAEVQKGDMRNTISKSNKTILIIGLLAIIIGIVISLLITRSIIKPIDKVKGVLARLAEGDFTNTVEVETNDEIGEMGRDLNRTVNVLNDIINEFERILAKVADGDFSEKVNIKTDNQLGSMAKSLNLAISSLQETIQDIEEVLSRVAEGDFTSKVTVEAKNELGKMANSLNETIDSLNRALAQVQDSSITVDTASDEIANGNQDLSQRTQEQASSLEEVSATIEQINASIQEVAASSEEASSFAKNNREVVNKGSEIVGETMKSMSKVTARSKEISDIINVVNDIAFQTNLLALNAAVEAARAGEHGKGFAVVAAEVRNLSARTAESAKEIENLISTIIEEIEEGNELVEKTGYSLEEIVQNSNQTAQAIEEIAAAMEEQSSAANQIQGAVEELNQVTQDNASMVEEIASSSELLNGEAKNLSQVVGRFRLNSVNEYNNFQENKSVADKKSNNHRRLDRIMKIDEENFEIF